MFAAALVLAGCAGLEPGGAGGSPAARNVQVEPVAGFGAPARIPATLLMPRAASGAVPAVVIVHGADGVDGRGAAYAGVLNAAGIATLEVDMWGPRRSPDNPTGQARSLVATLPDVYGALLFLARQPGIDPQRIGILGYGWGGGLAAVSASRRLTRQYAGGELRFAAHVPIYPICWTLAPPQGPFAPALQDASGAPMLFLAGAADDYDAPDSCERAVRQVPAAARGAVRANVFPGATHGWDDRRGAGERPYDPLAREGSGGPVRVKPDQQVAAEAQRLAVDAFRRPFGMPAAGAGARN